jgi:hypothetical protein
MIESIEPSLSELIVATYEGGKSKDNGLYEGNGLAIMDNKCQYQGSFSKGMFNGKGKFTWENKVEFDGDFVAGEMQGSGKYLWPDGSKYEGGVISGKRSGNGIFICSGGQSYDGEWLNGKRHGKGTMIYNEEKTIVYTGDWVCGLREGYGIMKYNSGNSFEGEWKKDQKSGRGVYLWKDNDEIYGGDWLFDLPDGVGEHIWGTGDISTMKSTVKQMNNIFRGEMKGGLRNGFGTFFYANGSQYSGNWLNNCKHGEGLFIHSDGNLFYGEFEHDRMMLAENIPRVSEDVSVQIHLNIIDILNAYPPALSYSDKTDNNLSDISVDQQIKNLERLLLRYHSYMKSFFRKYSDISNQKRNTDNKDSSIADPYTNSWTNVEKVIFKASNIYNRFNCMTIDTFKRFLLECGLMGPNLSSYDVNLCFINMRAEHKKVLSNKKFSHLCNKRDLGNDVANESIIYESFIPELIDSKAPTKLVIDSRYPIREREFFELLVRCIIDSSSKLARTEQSLFNIVFQVLAEKLYPFSLEKEIDEFAVGFYQDSVQELFSTNSNSIDKIWQLVINKSSANSTTIQLRHFIMVLLDMKGKEIKDDSTTMTILSIIYPSLNLVDNENDLSIITKPIDYNDFIQFWVRIVSSPIWLFNLDNENKNKVIDESEEVKVDEEVKDDGETPVVVEGETKENETNLEEKKDSELEITAPTENNSQEIIPIVDLTNNEKLFNRLTHWFESNK